MHKLYLLLAALCITTIGMAQTDSTKNPQKDTIRVGGMIIIRDHRVGPDPHSKNNVTIDVPKKKRNKKISTNWCVFDFGFNNFIDHTNYASPDVQKLFHPEGEGNNYWFDTRNGKSVNVNIWFFMQRVSLYKNIVNLKYGLGLSLYNYRYDQPLRYDTDPTNSYAYYLDRDHNYSKNKLATDFLTVPLMLNFNFTPNRRAYQTLGLSVGVSGGYLYSSRQKIIDEDGKNKIHNNFGLEEFKLAYIGELQLGPIILYGSLDSKSMFKKGLDQTPYAIGIRLSNW